MSFDKVAGENAAYLSGTVFHHVEYESEPCFRRNLLSPVNTTELSGASNNISLLP
jgi:hypothetical protein